MITKPIKSVLVANRGEIACRIFKFTNKVNIKSIAIYSDTDKHSLHTSLASKSCHIGSNDPHDSYLNIGKIIKLAKDENVDAIHPGYGFLSENPDFSKACEDAKIIFIGPSHDAMTLMSSKNKSKSVLSKSKVPIIPGFYGDNQDIATLMKEAKKIPFPILIKASAGGGGKGMRIVHKNDDLKKLILSAKREAHASFKDDKILIEPYFENARHIEVQIASDFHGNVIHLFDRDCSVQRRHQKLIEEAPATNISSKLRNSLYDTAIHITKLIDYHGVGTIEFLVDHKNNFYFMEMNTRLQVEHPVTEYITGVDLVELQFNIASGVKLPKQLSLNEISGHSIEARIYAEDPFNDNLPSTGEILLIQSPTETDNVRIDEGIKEKDHISSYYDPLLSKLIVWGENRNDAIKNMQNALRNYSIGGIKTNLSYLLNIISIKPYANNIIYTNYISKNKSLLEKNIDDVETILMIATAFAIKCNGEKVSSKSKKPDLYSPWNIKDAWQSMQPSSHKRTIKYDQTLYNLELIENDREIIFMINEKPSNRIKHILLENDLISIKTDKIIHSCIVKKIKNNIFIFGIGNHKPLELILESSYANNISIDQNHLSAPIPGTITDILVKPGDQVKKGSKLLMIEAMKMEHKITAHTKGIISKIHYKIGQQVNEGDNLIDIETC